MKQQQPNILFIHVDQLCLHAISAYGCEFAHTPHIDKLIDHGTSFMHSYTTEPICAPARASWWTGVYPTEHGSVFNATACRQDLTDLGQHLQASGYHALHVGKWGLIGRDVENSFTVTHKGSWAGEPTDPDVTKSAKAIIRNYDADKPFFMSVGYLNPHDCCTLPNDINEEATPHLIADQVIAMEELPQLPPTYHYDGVNNATVDHVKKHIHLGATQFKDIHWRYYLYQYARLCEKVDYEIGAVLDELERSDHKDNTVILFTTDHGDGAACHKTYEKSTLWDETVRVPFVIATLSDTLGLKKGERNSQFVSGVDVFPTVCDIAGIEPIDGLSGMSVYGAANGEEIPAPRAYAYAESVYYSRMIRSSRYKYIMDYKPEPDDWLHHPHHSTHQIYKELLYDMDDQGEILNLSDRAEYHEILAEHRSMLFEMEDRLNIRDMSGGSEQRVDTLHARLKGYRALFDA